jgi:hypothetical protein
MEESEKLVFSQKPMLRRPYVVCGLTGWVDGGEVAKGQRKVPVDDPLIAAARGVGTSFGD